MKAEQIKVLEIIILAKNTFIENLYPDNSALQKTIVIPKGIVLIKSLESSLTLMNSISLDEKIHSTPNPYHPLIWNIIWELAKQNSQVEQIEI